MNLSHAVLGICGILLIIIALSITLSSKYFSFFTKTFYIEPVSENGKVKMKEFVEKDKYSQRYIGSIVLIGLGIIAIAWSIGVINTIALPLLVLLAVISAVKYYILPKYE